MRQGFRMGLGIGVGASILPCLLFILLILDHRFEMWRASRVPSEASTGEAYDDGIIMAHESA